MTTTYELYTNENGTPKAVEGKAPAIIERVEALEADVKTLDVGVTSFNGAKGAITYQAPVSSVNGQTGEVSIPTGHNVGEEWVSYTGKIPNGGVPYCGQTVTRATYADLWAYAQAQGLVKTESEWQSWSSSHGGNVPYYSSGDGSTTFRMPSIKGYVKGASSQSESGSYVAEGLPNITGMTRNIYRAGGTTTGAFYDSTNTGGGAISGSGGNWMVFGFDASRSNSIYGNSTHVTPETSVVLFGVFAFGAVTNQGALDAETLATGLARVEANYLPLGGGTMTGKIVLADGIEEIIRQETSTERTIIRGGNNFSGGSSLYLSGKDSDNGGDFRLYAHDGTSSLALVGKPDGTLAWGGKGVVCVQSGTTTNGWYRKYSDGWVEQGGRQLGSTSTTVTSFPIAMKDTTYTALGTYVGSTDTKNYYSFEVSSKRTTTSIVFYRASNTTINWYVCGYHA